MNLLKGLRKSFQVQGACLITHASTPAAAKKPERPEVKEPGPGEQETNAELLKGARCCEGDKGRGRPRTRGQRGKKGGEGRGPLGNERGKPSPTTPRSNLEPRTPKLEATSLILEP